MLDISIINKRYFEISISVEDDEGKVYSVTLEVEPPKLKAYKKIVALSKDKDNEETLSEALRIILNKNRTGYKVPDGIIDNLDTDQYKTIFSEYSKWLSEVRNNPN